MLDDNEYSSDSSDEDYKPCGGESDIEEPSGGELSDESLGSEDENGKKKKKLPRKKKSKQMKLLNDEEEEAPTETKELSPEENKERIDNLWASFKKDVDSTATKKTEVNSTSTSQEPVKETTKVVEEYEFAGEKVKVTREVTKPQASSSSSLKLKRPPPVKTGGGFSNFFSSKKPKLTTLEKSKLDWDGFKKEEGIEEDLKTFNQGKQGFLEKKAFLERTDMKQFEIERGFRLGRKNGP